MVQASVKTLDKWHKTKPGYLVFGLAELALAYAFASLAIDSAHIWEYALATLFLIGGIQNLVRIFRAPKK